MEASAMRTECQVCLCGSIEYDASAPPEKAILRASILDGARNTSHNRAQKAATDGIIAKP